MPNDTLVVQFAFANIPQSVRGIQQMAKSLQQAVAPALQLDAAMYRIARSATVSAAAVKSMAQGANRAARSAGQSSGGAGGGGRRQQAGFAQRLRNLIYSTRVGPGMQMYPLIGRIMSLLPAELAPIGVAVTLAAGTLALFAAAVKSAAESAWAFRSAMTVSGGTAAQVGYANSLGGAFGLDMAQTARSLSSAIGPGGNPTARAFASQLGITDQGIWGDTDKMTNLLKLIDKLGGLSRTEALRTVRAIPGMPDQLADLAHISPDTRRGLMLDQQAAAAVHGGTFDRDAMEFLIALHRLGAALSNLVQAIVKPLLPYLVQGLTMLANALQAIAVYVTQPAVQQGIVEVLKALFGVPMQLLNALKAVADVLLEWIDSLTDSLSHGHGTHLREQFDRTIQEMLRPFTSPAAQSAMNHLDQSVDRLSQAVNGLYGGGERARGFIPREQQGNTFAPFRQGYAEAARLGAFAL